MKTIKRFFWLMVGLIMIFGYGFIVFFLLIAIGGDKMNKILPDPYTFLYNKLK